MVKRRPPPTEDVPETEPAIEEKEEVTEEPKKSFFGLTKPEPKPAPKPEVVEAPAPKPEPPPAPPVVQHDDGPKVALRVFAAAGGVRWDQLAGFRSYAARKKLGPFTMTEWRTALEEFQNTPV